MSHRNQAREGRDQFVAALGLKETPETQLGQNRGIASRVGRFFVVGKYLPAKRAHKGHIAVRPYMSEHDRQAEGTLEPLWPIVRHPAQPTCKTDGGRNP